jgi:hypothetical protein
VNAFHLLDFNLSSETGPLQPGQKMSPSTAYSNSAPAISGQSPVIGGPTGAPPPPTSDGSLRHYPAFKFKYHRCSS